MMILLSVTSYILYKFIPQIFPDLFIKAMPSRFLILHSFVGWPIIISSIYALLTRHNFTKKFIKIFIFGILIVYSAQHHKNFIKIKDGFMSNLLKENINNKQNIFQEISNLDLNGYFIVTSSTLHYTNRIALKPILVDTMSFDFIPYHPYLVSEIFQIFKDVYDVDIKNPPTKYNPYLPDSFIKKSFEKKDREAWGSIAKKYNAKYVVVPSDWNINLDTLKSNKLFSIYEIN